MPLHNVVRRVINAQWLLIITLCFNSCAGHSFPVTKTTIGVISGFVNDTTPNVVQYLGIPFAEPPLGSLRFAPPVAKSQFARIDATKFGASCPQARNKASTVYTVDSPDFLISGPSSEDCLTLNIWAPLFANSSSKKRLPVIVWLYGGNFQTRGGNTAYQIPDHWVERSQAHIVVGVNYRGNIYGFPNAAGLDQNYRNLGLLDQRLGLEFVRSHIASFGGDVDRITLWGQSAGSLSVDYYNFAYFQDSIVAGFIMDSGTALYPSVTYDPTHSNFTFVANNLGCRTPSPDLELDCMRRLNSTLIEAFLQSYIDNNTQPALSFNPIADNRTKFTNYTAKYIAKNITRVPAIIGTNANEGAALLPFNPGSPLGPNRAQVKDITLDGFLCPAVQSYIDRHAAVVPTFPYFYDGNFSNISPRPWEGAYHSSELPLIFGTSNIAHGHDTEFETALSHKMQDFWLAFITDPWQGLPIRGWMPYEPDGEVIEFGASGHLIRHVNVSELARGCNY